jgi:potassium-transporting ATPase potassium-binding subunit
MNVDALLLITLIVGGTAVVSWPLGRYMRWAMDPMDGAPRRLGLDRLFERIAGPLGRSQQSWKDYAVAMLVFNTVMFIVSFAFMTLQQYLPLNPDGKGAVEGSLVFNTVASFTSNTNLQHYAGEVSMSYLTQLVSLMWLQFVSAATGIAALAALARGLTGRPTMGNFFVDLQRAAFLVLLPVALVVAPLMALGGIPMTLQGAVNATTLEGALQTIARGPVAAFLTIKQLGTNGGGFFGPNSTHPFENPTFWTNTLSMICILLIPMGSVWMFGRIVGRTRHAATVFGVMLALLLAKIGGAVWFEQSPTRAFTDLPAVEQVAGNFEGKEIRFGTPYGTGPLWGVLTTSTSNGSVAAMHDSLNPMTGLMPMVGMWLNATFGGVGVGMINMFIYIIMAVFIAGMMVGRTPEYLNRRVEAYEMTLAILTAVMHGFFILVGAALFAATAWGQNTLNNWGPHGFSEILYEFSSASANNGSGFEGLSDNTVPWNVATGLVMLLNRYIPIILPLAIAGSLGTKRRIAESAGTLSVQDATFGVMLIATIVLIGALTFFPAAALGPIAEHFLFM